ncbi:RING finger and WD repeat domain-containing protein 2 [Mactra antiquata]
MTGKEENSCNLSAQREDDSSTQCAVCYDTISSMAEISKCGHTFCYECILRWTETKRNVGPNCPICRTNYDEKDIRTDNGIFHQNAGSESRGERDMLFQNEVRTEYRHVLQRPEQEARSGLRRRTGFHYQD